MTGTLGHLNHRSDFVPSSTSRFQRSMSYYRCPRLRKVLYWDRADHSLTGQVEFDATACRSKFSIKKSHAYNERMRIR